MNKKIIKSLLAGILGVLLIGTVFAGCSSKSPKSITVEKQEYLLGNIGAEYDFSKDLIIDGGAEDSKINFTSSDEAIVKISDEGVITAKNFGSVTITAASDTDKSVSATADILVYPYYGVYSAEKYIDAMGCDISVSLTLNEDGTYKYYRAPMYVDLDGGGEMPELEDIGKYAASGNKITFTGEYLNEFTLDFQIDLGSAYMQGNVPTGGASTQMQLLQSSADSDN